MIELENISVRSRGKSNATPILENITIDIANGEWIFLGGPNGSGKTTLLKAVAGLLPLDSGTLRYGAGSAPRASLLLQEPDNQFVAGSVQSELLLSIPQEVAKETAEQRFSLAVEQFFLGDILDRNPHRLSGGEKQRLAFATVWLSDPELLLLDEPTSYLDEVEADRCLRFVEELNRAGVSIVWATLDVPNGQDDRRIVYLDSGRVVYDGVARNWTAPDDEGDRTRRSGSVSAPHADAPDDGAKPVVSLSAVSFGYGERAVFENLSLDVREGECVGITGRNGSGKSTLLGILSGILKPTGGEIRCAYERAVEGGAQNTFYLFQSPERLFFAETVREEIDFGLRSLGCPKALMTERVNRALTGAGLIPGDFLERLPFSLSLGEMRRLAFAMALALEPRFLLLDEPTSCLDTRGRSIFLDLVAYFRREGRTVVLASHDKGLLSLVTDRIIEL